MADNVVIVKYLSGSTYHYLNGYLHREDGPAIEWANGTKFWYYKGKWIHCKNNQSFLRMIKLVTFL